MSRAIKLKNNDYLDSTGIVLNRETLSDYLNRKSSITLYGSGLISYSENQTGIAPMSGYNSFGNSLSKDGNYIKIGKGINRVLLSYSCRLDWDAPIDRYYYFSYVHNGVIAWWSHQCIVKKYNSQYMACFGGIILNVSEGDTIGLGIYSNTYTEANTDMFLTVQTLN